MKIKWDALLTITLIACALVTTGALVHREFFAPSEVVQASAQNPVFLKNWKDWMGKGVQLGPSGAAVQLIEFSDFECPFCASFNQTLKDLKKRYPTQVSLTYVHFPLPMHRFAMPAARAAECGDRQGRFEAVHDQLFEDQASFGAKPWSAYAAEAGVPDLAAFEACIDSAIAFPKIEAGKQLAAKLDIQGTPTLIVNGWKLAGTPPIQELDAMVKRVLSGKSPVLDHRGP
jgi:protein-disulfide isomerase